MKFSKANLSIGHYKQKELGNSDLKGTRTKPKSTTRQKLHEKYKQQIKEGKKDSRILKLQSTNVIRWNNGSTASIY